ncbi:MAG TPA: hypothetical protein VMN57_03230, partial [Anaerolineales bacterium]|nr:hypothetical protein [Anaerolineales bacterium]
AIYLLAAVTGILFCLRGIIVTWRTRPELTRAATENLALLEGTIDATRDGLDVVDQVLLTTSADLDLVHTSVHTLTLAIRDTNIILGSLATLTGTDLPASVEAAQTSLASAQTSALLIDNLLASLASIPFLGMGNYEPEVPLNVALGDLSASLDPLAPSLENVSEGLEGASTNLEAIELQLQSVRTTGEEINSALADAQIVIREYRDLLAGFKTQAASARLAAPDWITSAAWTITLLLGSLLFALVELAERGLELVRDRSGEATGAGTEEATGDGTGDGTGDATGEVTGEVTGDGTGEPTGDQPPE